MGKVIVLCEESQRVCKAFRENGHEAYSCDIKECSGGHPEWHIKDDALKVGRSKEWDLIIAHPPCTYLSIVANKYHSIYCDTLERINERTIERINAMMFFMEIAKMDCCRIAIENPVGIMNTAYRKPDQIIDPYMFDGDGSEFVTKHTCLWLKNLPVLIPSNVHNIPNNSEIFGKHPNGKNRSWESMMHSAETRSKTFYGIAKAMAEQWGGLI